MRDCLHVDDLARALLFILEAQLKADGGVPDVLNIGSGEECSSAEIATELQAAVGFDGELRYDASRPDGTPRKLLDSSKLLALGWCPAIGLRAGLAST